MVGCGGGSRAEVDSGEEDVASLGVEAHGLGTEFGLDGFGFAEFVGRIFVEDVDHAFAGGNEDETGFGFEGCGIYAGGDGKGLQNFAAVRVEDDELLGIAAGFVELIRQVQKDKDDTAPPSDTIDSDGQR